MNRDGDRGGRPRSQSDLLRAHGIRPQKRRGQNFLVDGNMARAIAAEVMDIGDEILELGAGAGALTFPLLEAGARVAAVEIDTGLQALLTAETAGRENFRLLDADLAKLDWTAALDAAGERPVVAGNLPYVLTSEVLFALVDHRARIAGAVFMVQREVAQRLAAEPGGREYGVLAVILGSLFTVRVLRQVPASVFWPRPDVVSAVVRLDPRGESWENQELHRFRSAVKLLFGQRRKQIGTILRRRLDLDEATVADLLARAEIAPELRPEQIDRARLRALARLLPEGGEV